MKTMKLQERIVRVSDERASELYMEGWQYTSKSTLKEQVRAKAGDVEMEWQDKHGLVKDKSNKISKAQKRHLRKKNK